MKNLRMATRYRRDLRRISKRQYDLEKLQDIVTLLREGDELPEAYKDHSLKGDWVGTRELHLASDWLLIYEIDEDEVTLLATGTHADVFD